MLFKIKFKVEAYYIAHHLVAYLFKKYSPKVLKMFSPKHKDLAKIAHWNDNRKSLCTTEKEV